MNSQKLENILNLSLDSTPEERERSGTLDVGFDREDRTWELIVKYHGDISPLESENVRVEILLAGYAIITLPESLIPALVEAEGIEYVEKPKELLYNVYAAKQQSCFPTAASGRAVGLAGGGDGLTGSGCIVAVFDSGIDYTLPDFRSGTESRILYLWDQTLAPDTEKGFFPPQGFSSGVEFSQEQITEALAEGGEGGFQRVPSTDISGHGTAVAAIAAGSNPDARYRGAAPGADLLIVKLGQAGSGIYPRTTQLMRAVTYALGKAQALGKPLAMNISFGNSYGAHDGSSLLERFMDNASEVWKNVICAGSGNEGAAAGHVSGRLSEGGPGEPVRERNVELAVGNYENTINVQLWKNFADSFRVILQAPSGQREEVPMARPGRTELVIDQTEILIFVGEPSPYSVNQEIYFDFLPVENFINAGVWVFQLVPVRLLTGEFQMYLPGQAVRSADTRFFAPTPELTLTIPSTAGKVITVGAIQGAYDAYADFSGRGVRGQEELPGFPNTKPDLAAPGVNIAAARAGGGYEAYTGTSFSAPLVTGAAALMMEWGIVRGNDPYMYGEKLKAHLRRGAREVRGENSYPNERTGYGALCVADSIPF